MKEQSKGLEISMGSSEYLDSAYDALPLVAQLYLQLADNLALPQYDKELKLQMRQGQVGLMEKMRREEKEQLGSFVETRNALQYVHERRLQHTFGTSRAR